MEQLSKIERLLKWGYDYFMTKQELKEIVILATTGQFRVAIVDSYAHLYEDQDIRKSQVDLKYIAKTFCVAKAFNDFDDAMELAKLIYIGYSRVYPISTFVVDQSFSDLYASVTKQTESNQESLGQVQACMYGTTTPTEALVIDPVSGSGCSAW